MFCSLEAFLDSNRICSGYYEINYGGLPIHFLVEQRGFPCTTVVFSQMVADDFESVPIIVGAGLTQSLPTDRILFSDPSMILSKTLRSGFYAGNSVQPHLQDAIVAIVQKIAKDRIIYFGTSDGGFAALVSALKTPGSFAAVSNPTVNIKLRTNRGNSIERFLELAWSSGTDILDTEAPFMWDVVKPFESIQDTTIFYHQNPADHSWEKWHYRNFRERCHSSNRIIWNESDVGQGHVFPTNQSLGEVISHLATSSKVDATHLSSLELRGYQAK